MFNIGHNSVFFPQAFQLPALRPIAPFQGGGGLPQQEPREHGQRWGPAVPPSHLLWWREYVTSPARALLSQVAVYKPVRGDLRLEGDKGFGDIAVTCLLFLCNLMMVRSVIA